ncbi:hypothetical protein [Fodinibius salsisoli]|uniref:Uncharacterized protein n=1 Tax=Fodinibius salsisoli TaxID=2820877 RepID=A0ABT3PL84_9BACT|nr:hypothetical protein [Fodinibius salsisoli]MCW9706716.1 hypothetical protein [Fodinibius salsisoli]
MKRSIRLKISLFLLMLTGIGLTITTLHSHHHLELSHPPDFADTGHCLSADTTFCPIVAHLYEKEVLSGSPSGDILFDARTIIIEQNIQVYDHTTTTNPGRSPPVLV